MASVVENKIFIHQSCTLSPQDLWPVVGCQERLWGTEIFSLQDFCTKKMQVKDRAAIGQPIKKIYFNFFKFPKVSSGKQPLAKGSEDSGYEIG